MNGPPLSPAVLSKLPLGLLGFFGIKNGGQYPQSLGTVISPTLEQLPILAANYHLNFAMSSTAPIVGFTAATNLSTGFPSVVPSGELWYVSALSFRIFTGAGDSITVTPQVRGQQASAPAGNTWDLATGPMTTQAASLNTLHPGSRSGFWLAPGDTFGIWCTALVNASGNTQVSQQVQVSVFPF